MPRKARKRGGKSAKRGISAEQIPVLVARDSQGATTDAVLPKLSRVSITAALGGIVTSANEFCCDGGTAIVLSPAGLVSQPTSCQCPASPTRERPISTSTTSMPTTAVSRNGCVPSMASRRKTCPITLAGAALWKHWARRSCPTILSSGLSDSPVSTINAIRAKMLSPCRRRRCCDGGKPNPKAMDFHLDNVSAYHGRLRRFQVHAWRSEATSNYVDWRRTLEARTERHIGRHDPRGYRNGTLSTSNAIRAKGIDTERPVSVRPQRRVTSGRNPLHSKHLLFYGRSGGLRSHWLVE
jgi:hypothetical protein